MAEYAAKPAVGLSDVSIAFRLASGGTYTAGERATLRIADGEFVALVGPTGGGKATPLHVPAAQRPGRAGRAVRGSRRYFWQSDSRGQPAGRLSVPGRRAVSLENGAGKSGHWA